MVKGVYIFLYKIYFFPHVLQPSTFPLKFCFNNKPAMLSLTPRPSVVDRARTPGCGQRLTPLNSVLTHCLNHWHRLLLVDYE